MRSVTLVALSVLSLLAFSTSAAAFEISMTTSYAGEVLAVDDTVTVDVFVDADPGLTFLGIGVVWGDDGVFKDDTDDELRYDGALSAALPVNPLCTGGTLCGNGAGASGAQPSYILYTGGKGATILYPQQTPAWLNWPNPEIATAQANINYAEPAFGAASNSGTGIYVASLVFKVGTAFDGQSYVRLCNTCGGSIVQLAATVLTPSDVPLTSQKGNRVIVPEPALASLAVAGLTTLYFVHRRRRA